jgi:dTDP-4-amino-4,6-dideoxygalactose transaminase
MGSFVNELEQKLSTYLGLEEAGKHLALVNTGHSALHLALVVAECGPGDEVIVPSFCCVSDFQAILSVGAEPVLCDSLDESLTIDVDSAETMVTPRTKAVIAMDYGSQLCDHDRVAAFAAKHGLRVIHDGAHTFGSKYKGRMVGSFSDMTMLSFDPVKTMTCLDAGALIVSSEDELRRIHELRILGMGQPPSVMYQNKRAWTFHVDDIGFRYHLINMHGAIGLAQLAKMDRISATRRAAYRFYLDNLSAIPGLRIPAVDLENVTPFIFYVRVAAEIRDAFRTYLGECGVDTGVHWRPGHHFKILDGCRRSDLSVAHKAGQEIVTLPLHSNMAREHQQQVVDAVRGFFSGAKLKARSGASALQQYRVA